MVENVAPADLDFFILAEGPNGQDIQVVSVDDNGRVSGVNGGIAEILAVRKSFGETVGYVSVTVLGVENNSAPVANAGIDHVLISGDRVVLDGSLSIDPDIDALIFLWAQTRGPLVSLSSSVDESVTVDYANLEDFPAELQFLLTVTDPFGNMDSDDVVVTLNRLANGKSGKSKKSDRSKKSKKSMRSKKSDKSKKSRKSGRK